MNAESRAVDVTSASLAVLDSVTKVIPTKPRRPWRKKFLRALAKMRNVTRSYRVAGISKMHAYRVFHASPGSRRHGKALSNPASTCSKLKRDAGP